MRLKKYEKCAPSFGRSSLTTAAAIAMYFGSTAAFADQPVKLSDAQLDVVSAGAVSVNIKAQSRGRNGSIGSSEVIVSSTADTDGGYTLETAVAVGQSYVCCNGGKTSVKVSRDGMAIKTSGGSVTSTIRLLNYGSYSFGIGVQIGLSAN